MKYNLVNWSGEYRNDGIAYMNQRIQEMLSHFADHVFSVPVCNTLTLLKEYLSVATQVRAGKVKNSNLEIIMREFQEAFQSDNVIKNHLDKTLSNEILAKINSASSDGKLRMMSFLHNKIVDYNEWCKHDLRELVLQEREKKKIESVLRSYISGLISGGYSRNYIYFFNGEVFNKFPVSSNSSLDGFLNRFDFAPREYTVYVAIDNQLERFKNVLIQRLGAVFDCEEEASDLSIRKKEKYTIIKLQIAALDHIGAARIAYDNLCLFTEFYKFVNDKKARWIHSISKVVDNEGTISFVKTKDDEFSFSRKTDLTDSGEVVEMLVSSLVYGTPNIFPLMQRIVDLHNTSLESANINNSFLNLWSILEVLFVYEHTESKIEELESKLIPILQKDYLRILFEKLYDDIVDNIPEDNLNQQVKEIDAGMNFNAFPCLILLPQYENEREQLIDQLREYPLIRSRIVQYNELYSRKKKVLADIVRFTTRISWHIRRLYRARNAIVHSGVNASNIKELSRHLHNYVDEAVNEVLNLIIFDDSISGIDNAVIEIQIVVDLMKKRLSSNDPICNDDIVNLFTPYRIQQEQSSANELLLESSKEVK